MGQSHNFLYCDENEGFDDKFSLGQEEQKQAKSCDIFVQEEDDCEEQLIVLKLKESKQTQLLIFDEFQNPDGDLVLGRKEAVEWMIKVISHYAYCVTTLVLAVNYFDRFVSSGYFQKDKPWMCQLVAVACLSLAAKVEETHVPLLIDLQVEECKYVFEARTIKRMELFVLSTLEWKMNLVTPVSYFDHTMRSTGFKNNLHWDFTRRCECLLLSIISDSRIVRYGSSVLAAAIMFHVIREIEPCDSLEYQNQLMGFLKISKDDMEDCYKLISELSSSHGLIQDHHYKRKHHSIPNSPNGVIDMSFSSFSSDNSNDSWTAFTAVITSTSSPEQPPLFKKKQSSRSVNAIAFFQPSFSPLKSSSSTTVSLKTHFEYYMPCLCSLCNFIVSRRYHEMILINLEYIISF